MGAENSKRSLGLFEDDQHNGCQLDWDAGVKGVMVKV